jgi:hypothetical protein
MGENKMDLLQEIKSTLDGLIPDKFLPCKDDITDKKFDEILYSIVEVLEMVNREINKKEKHFLMS